GGALMAGLAFVWGLMAKRHEKDIKQVWDAIEDHEERLRNTAPKSDIDRLCRKMDDIRQEVHDAKTQGCAHNAQTREMMISALRETESRISGMLMAFMRGSHG